MPTWLRNTLALLLVGIFSVSFYLFCHPSLFLSLERVLWSESLWYLPAMLLWGARYRHLPLSGSHWLGQTGRESGCGIPTSPSSLWRRPKEAIMAMIPLNKTFRKQESADLFVELITSFRLKPTRCDRPISLSVPLNYRPGDLPPVLDVEVRGKKTKKELQHNIKRWLDRVEAHYGVKPILYTSYKFKTSYLDDSLFQCLSVLDCTLLCRFGSLYRQVALLAAYRYRHRARYQTRCRSECIQRYIGGATENDYKVQLHCCPAILLFLMNEGESIAFGFGANHRHIVYIKPAHIEFGTRLHASDIVLHVVH